MAITHHHDLSPRGTEGSIKSASQSDSNELRADGWELVFDTDFQRTTNHEPRVTKRNLTRRHRGTGKPTTNHQPFLLPRLHRFLRMKKHTGWARSHSKWLVMPNACEVSIKYSTRSVSSLHTSNFTLHTSWPDMDHLDFSKDFKWRRIKAFLFHLFLTTEYAEIAFAALTKCEVWRERCEIGSRLFRTISSLRTSFPFTSVFSHFKPLTSNLKPLISGSAGCLCLSAYSAVDFLF